MFRFVSAILAGLSLGGTFALVALGLVLAFRATRTFNFAHGELLVLGAFVVGFLQLHHQSTAVAIPAALVITALVGAGFYVLVLRKTVGQPLFMGIIATFGLAAILDGSFGILFRDGRYAVSIPALPEGVYTIGGVHVTKVSVIFTVITLSLAFIVAAVIRLTHLGLTIRAAGQDPLLASQAGIPVRKIYLFSWALAGMLAAVAGIAYASTSVADVSMLGLGLAAFPAIALGGMDSIEGAVLGGLVIGMVESFTQTYLGGQYVNPVTYSILLVILLVYPQGVLGTKSMVRA
jgi:branched-chain amino acid transport system permease protein